MLELRFHERVFLRNSMSDALQSLTLQGIIDVLEKLDPASKRWLDEDSEDVVEPDTNNAID